MINRRTAAWAGDEVWGAEEHLQGLWAGAVTIETPVVSRKTAPSIRVRNASAISMRVALRGGPEWLLMAAPAQLPAQAVTLLRPAFTPAMPAGEHAVQLQIEVMNLHPSPGRNLTVTVPLSVRND